MEKPHAPATLRNRDPILDVLRQHFARARHVLEIGSGSGEHAVYFAAAMPWLQWQCSDLPPALPGITAWLEEAGLPNTPPPVALDVSARRWPCPGAMFDGLFSANTLHIMGWPQVEALFERLPTVLRPGATMVVYGPFNVGGRFTSDSNEAFDRALRQGAPERGIRDLEAVEALAAAAGLQRVDEVEMPANNRCVVWRMEG